MSVELFKKLQLKSPVTLKTCSTCSSAAALAMCARTETDTSSYLHHIHFIVIEVKNRICWGCKRSVWDAIIFFIIEQISPCPQLKAMRAYIFLKITHSVVLCIHHRISINCLISEGAKCLSGLFWRNLALLTATSGYSLLHI